jgi:general secretion pathway protein E
MIRVNTGLAQLSQPAPVRPPSAVEGWLEFASYLIRKFSINGDLLSKLGARDQPPRDKRLRDLWELTELSASEFADEVARFYKLPRATLPQLLAATPLSARFSRRFLRESIVYPCQTEEHVNALIVADPSDSAAIHAAEIVLGGPVTIRVASFDDIATALSEGIGEEDPYEPESGEPVLAHSSDDVESLRDLASGAPVVRAVNDLLEKAMEIRATDIHIEPFRTGLVVRMRIDGLLRPIAAPADVIPQAMISRIKILAGLNIAERRLPQDGAAHLRIARSNIDIRVATMPTHYGESAVIRLLPKDRGVLDIAKLGLSISDDERLRRLLGLPHGMIVVTGPTGSGKTTTLATMLTALNDATRKILTIEDPIEYEIRGVNQSQVKPEIGLSFSAALRAFVRQDPDVIMVGEVRDAETAKIAVHAALTGHLVLTTLHTETAAAAVPRLLDLGIENFLLQSTLRSVIAQRLVRVLCERCNKQRQLTAADLQVDPRYLMLGFQAGDTIHEPAGCERCSGTGYRGRTGVFEIIETTDEVRGLIGARSDSGTITRAAKAAGMTTMFEHAAAKCRGGETSVAEVFRVTTMG